MKKFILVFGFVATAQAAQAEDCSDLGVDNAYLMELFCTELRSIVEKTPTTRSITNEDQSGTDEQFNELWANVKILKDAYRADPETTLELIDRIRRAGGLLDE